MSIQNKEGKHFSFDSELLIEELKQDIAEFGNIKLVAKTKFVEGAKLYTDYLFAEDVEMFIEKGISYDTVEARYLLKYLRKQNEII